MAATRGVWAIDIGVNALKALRLQHGDEGIEVIGFAYLEHSQNLSSEDVAFDEKDEIVEETLRKFLDEHEVGKEEVAISIAGQNSFARFIKLPPVEPKKIPEIVQFEAVQQIPFDINEVEWDWQLMETEDSPDKKVGLFAIKNELISEVMDHFTKEKLRVTHVQIAPMALYNYAYYDRIQGGQSSDEATVILDIGAENTTLVICTDEGVWQRSIRIGGNSFTEAISDAFHKGFATSEKLKRTAPMSKYMRQIYTAMKPVYTDLGGEIQRSIGFYTSSPEGRDKTFSKIIAVGGGMKLQGLAKYLTSTLGVPVIKPDSFERLQLSPDVSSAKFHENISDFAVVYGLGTQMLDEAKIATNLLPRKIARAMAWNRKAKMFTIAASVLLLVMVSGLARAYMDSKKYDSYASIRATTDKILRDVGGVKSEISSEKNRRAPLLEKIKKEKERFLYRDVVPKFNETVLKCLPNKDNTPSQATLFEAFEAGDVQGVVTIPRPERKQLFVTRFVMEFAEDVKLAPFPKPDSGRRRSRGPRTRQQRGNMMDPMMMDPMRMRMMQMMEGGVPGPSNTSTTRKSSADDSEVEGGPGFTVLIEGYSPYQDIAALLDPPKVGSDQDRWGVVTRFLNLEKLFPGTPFKLFNKHEVKHFEIKTGPVDLMEKDLPSGIGVERTVERVPKEVADERKNRRRTDGMMMNPMMMEMMRGGVGGGTTRRGLDIIYEEDVLVDPMTNEEISKTYDIITQDDIDADPDLSEKDRGRKKYNKLNGDEQFIERDQWFRIQAKFIWTEAPKKKKTTTAVGGYMGM
jgi:type IV pilus assembly protein PilM